MRILKFLFLLLLLPAYGFGQVVPGLAKKSFKGKFYFYWGWNRGYYSNSDIHLKGTNYNFTLYDVVSTDKQSKFALNPYLNPTGLTIPQFNARLGYYITEHYSLSLGDDHMKYLMTQNQTVKISGEINDENYNKYNGTYNNVSIVVAEDLLTLQHCDGLNYLNIELRREDEIYNLKKIKAGNIGISFSEGIGLGALMPRTEAILLMNPRYHEFHFAGYGGAAIAALKLQFWKHFFIESELKGGFINMPDIRTTNNKGDKASQHFFFLQRNIVFGYRIRDK